MVAQRVVFSVAWIVGLGLLAGCSGAEGLGAPNLSAEEQAVLADAQEISGSETLDVPAGVDPDGVVLAALLASNGDAVLAVEEGLVSPSEMDLALEAIAKGSLQDWVDLAEA